MSLFKALITILFLTQVTIPAYSAETYINGDWLGCKDKEEWKTLTSYVSDGDKQAFALGVAIGLRSGRCVEFVNRERIYLVDTQLFSGMIKIRRPGSVATYWTSTDAIKTSK